MTTIDTVPRTVRIPTWTRGTVLAVWAAAALPMAALSWGAPRCSPGRSPAPPRCPGP